MCIMKKVLSLICLILICALLPFTSGCASSESEYLRLHIRANSNLECDQLVKLKVRDAVIDYLTPVLSEAEDVREAEKLIESRLPELEKLCNETLLSQGYSYGARARITDERFPTKSYGDLVLEGGVYRAVIIELGSGEGDNWWCVAYPPLCFIGEDSGGNIRYKSIIMEIIEKWRKNENQNKD